MPTLTEATMMMKCCVELRQPAVRPQDSNGFHKVSRLKFRPHSWCQASSREPAPDVWCGALVAQGLGCRCGCISLQILAASRCFGTFVLQLVFCLAQDTTLEMRKNCRYGVVGPGIRNTDCMLFGWHRQNLSANPVSLNQEGRHSLTVNHALATVPRALHICESR